MKIILAVLLFELIGASCFNNDEVFILMLPNLCYFAQQYHESRVNSYWIYRNDTGVPVKVSQYTYLEYGVSVKNCSIYLSQSQQYFPTAK